MKKISSMTYLIIGMILTGVGIGFTVIGTLQQNKEAEKFQDEVIKSQEKSLELSERLTKFSEDRFKQLTKPSINVIGCEEYLTFGLDSYFKIIARNTGNNDCENSRLIIDKHSSPLGLLSEITSYTNVPKDSTVFYPIHLFISNLGKRIFKKEEVEEFKTDYYKRYLENITSLVIHFHFEYEWNEEILKSSQYTLVKTNNQRVYISSSKEYIEN